MLKDFLAKIGFLGVLVEHTFADFKFEIDHRIAVSFDSDGKFCANLTNIYDSNTVSCKNYGYICLELKLDMKLYFAILFVGACLFCEVSDIIDMSNAEVCVLDISYEGESEKEASENQEDMSELKFSQKINFQSKWSDTRAQSVMFRVFLSTPHLEIYSPPPEFL